MFELTPEQKKARWFLIKETVERHKLNKEKLEKKLKEQFLAETQMFLEQEVG